MLSLILFLPLFSFLVSISFGRRLGLGVTYIACLNVFLAFLISIFSLYSIVSNDYISFLSYWSWVSSDSLQVNWGFYLDSLTAVMLVVITFISTLVHLYSTEYMKEDPHLQRFMSYLSLFTFFMLVLVTADNFLQMFVGWEGVGLASYLLINFWFSRVQANKSAIKAMLLNRIGDFFLLLALFLIYYVFETLDYSVVFSLAPLFKETYFFIFNTELRVLDCICLFLFLGAMGKSAQLGLHTWLPDAMEGPTPVSALIHAATMVTAGVFLIIRCSFLFELCFDILNVLCVIGSLTAFFGASVGLFQNDLKKIIAYSTCSQLGYMIFACGLSNYNIAMFHLSNHAFFKALLFLGAGSIIHSVSDEQDIRRLGGLLKLLPFAYSNGLIGSLALVGFPFFAGFYSKDSLLESAFSLHTNIGFFCYLLGSLSALFTAFYSTRLLILVFLSDTNSNKNIMANVHEGSIRIKTALFLLAILSVTVGFLSSDLFIGFGSSFWQSAIFITPSKYSLVDIEFIPLFFKLIPLMLTLTGFFLATFFYSFNIELFFAIKKNSIYKTVYTFVLKKWYIDKLYNSLFVSNILAFGYRFTYQKVDRGLLEVFGPYMLSSRSYRISMVLDTIQKGVIHIYLVFLGLFVIFITFILYFSFSSLLIYFLFFLLLLLCFISFEV
jgi:NADH-ubiquinone oxidoreductase chain 5